MRLGPPGTCNRCGTVCGGKKYRDTLHTGTHVRARVAIMGPAAPKPVHERATGSGLTVLPVAIMKVPCSLRRRNGAISRGKLKIFRASNLNFASSLLGFSSVTLALRSSSDVTSKHRGIERRAAGRFSVAKD